MKLLIILIPGLLLAQSQNILRLTPIGPNVGRVEFAELFANGQHAITAKAPDSLTASYTLTLPTAAPANNGDCLVGTTAGVLSFATCSGAGGIWTASGGDVYRATGNVTVGSTTPDGKLTVVSSINDGLTLNDGTVRGIVWPSSVATNSLVVGTTSNHPVILLSNNAEALRVSPGGALLTRSHITTVSPSAADIGDATNYFQTVYVENIDATVGSVSNQYIKGRKLEIADIAGSSGFWDQRVNAVTATSNWTLRDNAGSRALVYTRVFSSSPDNAFEIFGTVLPAQRATGSGDAVSDATAPSLGATGRRWAAVWAAEGTFTSEVKSPTFTASADFTGAVNNVTNVGTSSVRMANVWTTGLNASGTITFPTGAASGRVWTSDGSGNGSWAVPATSPWTTSGSDIYFNGAYVTIGGTTPDTRLTVRGAINEGISVSDGTARGIMYSSAALTNSIVFGTTSAHPLIVFSGNAQHSVFWPSGNSCVGCSNDTYKWEVNGTFRAAGNSLIGGTLGVTGAATLSSTLGVTGLSTLTGGATFGAALSPSVTDTHDIGSATRFRSIYGKSVNAESLEVANSTFVTTFWRHSLNSAATYRIESGSGGQIEMQMGTISSTSSDVGFRGTLYPLSTSGSNGDLGFSGTPWRALYLSTGFRLTSGAAAGRVLTSDASGNGSWVAPSSGTVTSIATTLPISGGTITTTGTISCATCATTDTNQTITGTKTFQSSLAAAASDTYDIGSATRFRAIYGKSVNAESLEIANSTFVTTFWRHSLNSAATYRIESGSGSQIEMQMGTISSTSSDVGFRGTLYPLSTSGSNGDLGFSGTPWRTLYLSTSAFMNGTQWMDSSRNLTNLGTGTFGGSITANGGISTASGTNSTMYVGSGNLYLRTFSGADASCSGVTNGWVGFRTDTDELQVCNGGSVKKVSLL